MAKIGEEVLNELAEALQSGAIGRALEETIHQIVGQQVTTYLTAAGRDVVERMAREMRSEMQEQVDAAPEKVSYVILDRLTDRVTKMFEEPERFNNLTGKLRDGVAQKTSVKLAELLLGEVRPTVQEALPGQIDAKVRSLVDEGFSVEGTNPIADLRKTVHSQQDQINDLSMRLTSLLQQQLAVR